MSRFAVLGSPIAHSVSPIIHQAFAKEAKLNITFEKILTVPGTLQETLTQFKSQGGVGACITLPLKIEAYELCDKLTSAASTAKAVNTVFWQNDALWGDNTDGEGLLAFLQEQMKLSLAGKRILILGAGGATRGILPPLMNAKVQSIVIVNRTLAKASALCTHKAIKCYDYETFNASNELPFYLIINATSLSLQNELPPILPMWVKDAQVVDLAYQHQKQTVFQQWAKENAAINPQDGIGMLVWQAALGFKRWHHFLPKVAPVIELLRLRAQ